MLKNILYAVAIIALILLIIYAALFFGQKDKTPIAVEVVPVVTGQAIYQCTDNHTIKAVFEEKGPVPAIVSGEPPTSNAYVVVNLDVAGDITLPQALSADGARYANVDESLVFWNKGSGVMLLENGEEKTYKNCIEVKEDPGNLPQVYLDEVNRFTLRYPTGYTVDDSYHYDLLGPDTHIAGVKFTIPDSLATGTNLSKDSYISVEHINDAQNCAANDFVFLPKDTKPQVVEGDEFTYSIASTTDAGAGNRYEEHAYALVGTNPCLAIRYFIHYTAIENYDPGTVTEFNKSALLMEFDKIRMSLTLDSQIAPSPLLTVDVYPLYAGLKWDREKKDEFAGMSGYSVSSLPSDSITDIASTTQPFEKYYADLLLSKGWAEDISHAAGGPGSAVVAYKKDNDYIILNYTSSFEVNKDNEPAQCPCRVTFTIFSGSKK